MIEQPKENLIDKANDEESKVIEQVQATEQAKEAPKVIEEAPAAIPFAQSSQALTW